MWWDTLVGPGKPVDTDRFFVICPNLLGGCRGTTGPSSTNPATGEPYGLRFPLFTVRDLVTVHRALLEHLGVRRLHTAIGGSLGGMQALQWALDHPAEVERAVLVCASARLTAQNIAFSKAARAAIRRDGAAGMAFARMMAHITYLSEQGMELKFGRARRAEGPMTMDSDFEVEHYLDHQAEIFLARFDPLHLPLPLARHGLLRPVRGARRRGRTRASSRSPSTATGASAPSTRATSPASSRRSAPTCAGTRSRRRGGTTPSSWTFPGTRRRWRPSS